MSRPVNRPVSQPGGPGVDVLSQRGRQLLERPRDELRARYQRTKYVQLDDMVVGERLAGLLADLLPAVRRYAIRIVKPHRIEPGSLQDGRRFARIDPGPFEQNTHSAADRAAIEAAFAQHGLTGWAEELRAAVQPFVEDIVGRRLRYDRVFLLYYRERDFIAPHGDTQTSRRIMVQLPVAFACRTAFRVLEDGWLEPYYDDVGALRIMGPGIWHDVLPVLRSDPERDPERVVVTLRLPYADD